MDTDWQGWHARLGPLRGCLWDPPGASTKRMARLLATEARRWREEQLATERILICACTILYRAPDVTGSKDIAKTVERRMDQWEKGDFEQLVQEAERNNALLATRPVGKDDANEATLRQFRRLVDKDKVLESKDPAQSDPDPSCFLDRPLRLLTQVEITPNHIERAARATKGGAGPVGGESSVWKQLLLKGGAASAELRSVLAAMASTSLTRTCPGSGCRPCAHRPADEGPQAWFADVSAKVGGLQPVREWWDELQRRGPLRGYHPNAKKTKLVVRAGCKERAREVFGDTDVEIVSGARYMGGFVGTAEGKRAYAAERVQEWQRCVNRMADAAAKYPQAAHTALTTSLQAEWDFFMRVMPEDAFFRAN
ncbi:unnamed protein product [Vitrella brassicaformis CCMP3155]|uniref:Uncharacterized protein n=1 Tax=Vitrella brassicaformis (strain CCMP3155) TaxID=1169540 RepID=A0A0G4H0J8_VITBC|nr:unnamed protein product [Vitrella brassicaformis CCMP3155]|eukprot:CEM37044.1 unnamed protein product [Vitrella brassicaformis CCMP3155]